MFFLGPTWAGAQFGSCKWKCIKELQDRGAIVQEVKIVSVKLLVVAGGRADGLHGPVLPPPHEALGGGLHCSPAGGGQHQWTASAQPPLCLQQPQCQEWQAAVPPYPACLCSGARTVQSWDQQTVPVTSRGAIPYYDFICIHIIIFDISGYDNFETKS